MFGVRIRVFPKLPRSPKPRSSARISTTLGGPRSTGVNAAGVAEGAGAGEEGDEPAPQAAAARASPSAGRIGHRRKGERMVREEMVQRGAALTAMAPALTLPPAFHEDEVACQRAEARSRRVCWPSPAAAEASPRPRPAVPTPTPVVRRPNIVVVLADDLDVPTTLMLPRLPDLVENKGISFTRAYATQPLCAPSRASILTGQYTHNHGVTGNEPPSNGFVLFRRHEGATLATWLKSAGYQTGLVGKYMNAYAWGAGEGYIPPGWDEWYGHLAAMEDNRYWDYWVNDQGDVYRHGHAPEDYSVDLEAKRAVKFIRDSASRPEPIFLYAAPQAPAHARVLRGALRAEFRYSFAPRPPSFNESDVRNKPSWIRQIEYMTDAQIDDLDRFERYRLRCTRAVEEEIAGILQALDETGRLENTYFFFLSDNGLLLGEHRAVGRKNNVYEETIGIPFMVRGPGVAPRKVDEIVLNIDLAPTLLELAGVPIPETVDGASLSCPSCAARHRRSGGRTSSPRRTASDRRSRSARPTRSTPTTRPRSSSCTTRRRTPGR